MAKYCKKPVVIEAIKWCKDNCEEMLLFLPKEFRCFSEYGELHIITLKGIMLVSEGDYVIKGVNGKYYPCKPDIFEKTYEIVEEQEYGNK